MSELREYPKWIDPKQGREKPATPDERRLINGNWQETMREMAESTEMGKYVKTINDAKKYAVVWLGLSPSNPYSRLLHTTEMEEMLKQVFRLEN